MGLSYIGFALSPTLAVACGAAVVGGMGNGVQWAALISSVQHLTPRELLGRLMSTVEGIGALCPAIGFVLGGLLAQLTSPRTAMLWIGVAAALCTVLFLRVTRGEIAPALGGPTHVRPESLADMGEPLAERDEAASIVNPWSSNSAPQVRHEEGR